MTTLVWTPLYAEACWRAIKLYAQVEKSDPFAASRLFVHLRNGCEREPDMIVAHCETVLTARHDAIEADFAKWKEAKRG